MDQGHFRSQRPMRLTHEWDSRDRRGVIYHGELREVLNGGRMTCGGWRGRAGMQRRRADFSLWLRLRTARAEGGRADRQGRPQGRAESGRALQRRGTGGPGKSQGAGQTAAAAPEQRAALAQAVEAGPQSELGRAGVRRAELSKNFSLWTKEAQEEPVSGRALRAGGADGRGSSRWLPQSKRRRFATSPGSWAVPRAGLGTSSVAPEGKPGRPAPKRFGSRSWSARFANCGRQTGS